MRPARFGQARSGLAGSPGAQSRVFGEGERQASPTSRLSMGRASCEPRGKAGAGHWKPREAFGRKESPAFAGPGGELIEGRAARPRKTTARRGLGVVEYGSVPRRAREFTRVETCKTQRCARSLKREACFFSGGSRIKRQAMGRNQVQWFRNQSKRHGSPTAIVANSRSSLFRNRSKRHGSPTVLPRSNLRGLFRNRSKRHGSPTGFAPRRSTDCFGTGRNETARLPDTGLNRLDDSQFFGRFEITPPCDGLDAFLATPKAYAPAGRRCPDSK